MLLGSSIGCFSLYCESILQLLCLAYTTSTITFTGPIRIDDASNAYLSIYLFSHLSIFLFIYPGDSLVPPFYYSFYAPAINPPVISVPGDRNLRFSPLPQIYIFVYIFCVLSAWNVKRTSGRGNKFWVSGSTRVLTQFPFWWGFVVVGVTRKTGTEYQIKDKGTE